MFKPIKLDVDSTAGHLCLFYKDGPERSEIVAEYIRQGLANNELCIFATSQTIDQTVSDFADYGIDIKPAVKNGSLLIFEMLATYLSDGKFISNYMLRNVHTFIQDAKNQGFSGLRTAGEMSWLSQYDEYTDEAITYEHEVNSLKQPDFNFIGLCLYHTEGITDTVAQGALDSHPTLLFNGTIARSPFFAVA